MKTKKKMRKKILRNKSDCAARARGFIVLAGIVFFACLLFLFSSCDTGVDGKYSAFVRHYRSNGASKLDESERLLASAEAVYLQRKDGVKLIEIRIWRVLIAADRGMFGYASDNLKKIEFELSVSMPQEYALKAFALAAKLRLLSFLMETEEMGKVSIELYKALQAGNDFETQKHGSNMDPKIMRSRYGMASDISLPIVQTLLEYPEGPVPGGTVVPVLDGSESDKMLKLLGLWADKGLVSGTETSPDGLWRTIIIYANGHSPEDPDSASLLAECERYSLKWLKAYLQFYRAKAVPSDHILENSPQIINDYQEALPVFQILSRSDYSADCLTSLGQVYIGLGRYFDARASYSNAESLYADLIKTATGEKTKKGHMRNRAECFNQIASIDKLLGNLASAESCYRTAAEIYNGLEDMGRLASVYNNLGVLASLQLDYASALRWYDKALAITDGLLSADPSSITLYQSRCVKINNKAELLILQNQHAAALKEYLEPLLISLDNHGLGGLSLAATVRMNIAKAQRERIKASPDMHRKEYDAMIASLIIAEKIFTGENMIKQAREATFLRSLMNIDLGDYNSALPVIEQSVKFATDSKDLLGIARMAYYQYYLLDLLGRTDDANNSLAVSVSAYDDFIRLVPSEKARSALYDEYRPYCEMLVRRLIGANRPAEAFAQSEGMKARNLLLQFRQRSLDPLMHISSEYVMRLKELDAMELDLTNQFERACMQTVTGAETIDQTTARVSSAIEEIKESRADVFKDIRISNASIADMALAQTPTPEQIQACLKKGEVIVSYVFAENTLAAFIVKPESIQIVLLDSSVDRERLNETIQEFRTLIADRYSKADKSSSTLYKLLLEPVLPALEGANRIVIAPVDDLFYIPFHVLRPDSKAKYFCDRTQADITYALSASALVELRQRERPVWDKKYFGLGGVLYSDPFPMLPATIMETANAAAVFSPLAVSLTGKDASETRIKTEPLDMYQFIHFCCHGINYGPSDFPTLNFPALVLGKDEKKRRLPAV